MGDGNDIVIDTSAMPRLARAPTAHTAEQAASLGIGRHHSMEDTGRRTLMWNPALQAAHGVFTNYLRDSTCLSPRDRELAILRHAWDCGSDYQWGMHVEIGRTAGLGDEEIDRVTQDPDEAGWAPRELAVIRAVDELHAASRIGDETWVALAEHYDEAQVIELLALVGSYRLLAYIMSSVGIRPPAGRSPDLPGNSFLFTAPDQPED